jgi:hypothetical protein
MSRAKRSRTALSRLEDFRLLPAFVLVSKVIGVTVGKILNISDFELTPPIDAITSLFDGTFEAGVPQLISLGVPIGLFLMMYPARRTCVCRTSGTPSVRLVSSPRSASSTT